MKRIKKGNMGRTLAVFIAVLMIAAMLPMTVAASAPNPIVWTIGATPGEGVTIDPCPGPTTDVHAQNQILVLDIPPESASIILASESAILTVTPTGGGANRQFTVWTDLTGGKDLTYAETDTGVVRSANWANNAANTPFTLEIPRELLVSGGNVATQIFISFHLNSNPAPRRGGAAGTRGDEFVSRFVSVELRLTRLTEVWSLASVGDGPILYGERPLANPDATAVTNVSAGVLTAERTNTHHGVVLHIGADGIDLNPAANTYTVNVAGRFTSGTSNQGRFRVQHRAGASSLHETDAGETDAFNLTFTINTGADALRFQSNAAAGAQGQRNFEITTLTVSRVDLVTVAGSGFTPPPTGVSDITVIMGLSFAFLAVAAVSWAYILKSKKAKTTERP